MAERVRVEVLLVEVELRVAVVRHGIPPFRLFWVVDRICLLWSIAFIFGVTRDCSGTRPGSERKRVSQAIDGPRIWSARYTAISITL
jgi:hypothetical protein